MCTLSPYLFKNNLIIIPYPTFVTGECALIDEIMVGEDKLIRFSGCKSGTACTVILRGASSHLLGKTFVFVFVCCVCFDFVVACTSHVGG